jgi:nucleoside-diphosphate-sugar epimerase
MLGSLEDITMTHIRKTAPRKTALVIGATGSIGGAVARTLIARGWAVKALNRDPERAAAATRLIGAEWVKGDAMNPAEVVAAAEGADLIVHAANPPGYQNWDKLVGPMMASSIAAARATGARILLPGNVYNYGPDAGAVVTEASPENPLTRKGRIRVAMERELRASGVKALIVRAGDFFGPGGSGSSWFAQMAKPGKPVRSAVYPGRRGVGHAWAYLPDLAEAMVRLAEREDELEPFAVFNFGGTWFERGEDMARAILRVAEQPENRVHGFPWPLVVAASPFVPLFRELLEMRYLWQRPLRLDNSKLEAFLGAEPATPLDRAVAMSLEAMGCLEADWPVQSAVPVTA